MFGKTHEDGRCLKLKALDQLKNLGKTIVILKKNLCMSSQKLHIFLLLHKAVMEMQNVCIDYLDSRELSLCLV